jgi:HAMP domain-containing protein
MTEELVKRLREHRPAPFQAKANIAMREAADAIEALQAEIERLTYDGIHTCHADCPRLPCVQRREIEGLRADVRHLTNELQAHKDALAQVKGSSDD